MVVENYFSLCRLSWYAVLMMKEEHSRLEIKEKPNSCLIRWDWWRGQTSLDCGIRWDVHHHLSIFLIPKAYMYMYHAQHIEQPTHQTTEWDQQLWSLQLYHIYIYIYAYLFFYDLMYVKSQAKQEKKMNIYLFSSPFLLLLSEMGHNSSFCCQRGGMKWILHVNLHKAYQEMCIHGVDTKPYSN